MLGDNRVVVVMPAYNAARTLRRTYDEVFATGIVDRIVVVDDASHDETVAIARTLPNVVVHVHATNLGYGGNRKTCTPAIGHSVGASGTAWAASQRRSRRGWPGEGS
jgi:GT2 family glycosyltransferase